MNEIGRADLAAGARQRAWALGARSHDDFRLLWPLYRTERPTTETWGILKEAVLAAEEQKDVNYLLDVQNESHGQTYRGYYARDPVVPFQDPVLLRAFENVLGPLRPTLAPIAPLEGRPLRICCVMGGEQQRNTVPYPMLCSTQPKLLTATERKFLLLPSNLNPLCAAFRILTLG